LSNLDNVQPFTDKVNNIEAIPRRFHGFTFSVNTRTGRNFNMSEYQTKLRKLLEDMEDAAEEDFIKAVCDLVDSYVVIRGLDIMTGRTAEEVTFSVIFDRLVREWKRKADIHDQCEELYNKMATAKTQMFRSENGWSDSSSIFTIAKSDQVVDSKRPPTPEPLNNGDGVLMGVWKGVETKPVVSKVPPLDGLVGLTDGARSCVSDSTETVSLASVANRISLTSGIIRERERQRVIDLSPVQQVMKDVLFDNNYRNFEEAQFGHYARLRRASPQLYVDLLKNTQKYTRSFNQATMAICVDVMTNFLETEVSDIFLTQVERMCEWLKAEGVAPEALPLSEGVMPLTTGELLFVSQEKLKIKKLKPFPGITKWLTYLGIAAGTAALVAGVVTGVVYLVDYFRGVAQTGYSDTEWRIQPKRAPPGEVGRVLAQSANERHEKIRKNIRKLRLAKTSEFQSTLCIDNRTLCINHHFYDAWLDSGSTMEISEHGPDGTILGFRPLTLDTNLTRVIASDMGPTDMVVATLKHTYISGITDIRHFIPLEAVVEGVRATLLHMNCELDQEGTLGGALRSVACVSSTEKGTKRAVNICGQAFEFQTAAGDCGRPYVVRGERPLIGLHCAASANRTYFIPFSLDMFPKIMETTQVDAVEIECGPKPEWWTIPVPNYGTAQMNGELLSMNQPPKSDYVPLEYNGLRFSHPDWENEMRPANLSSRGPESALYKSAHKYERTATHAIPVWVFERVTEYWKEQVTEHAIEEMSLDEAINGIDGDDGLKSLCWKTSAGWLAPHIGGRGKHNLFDIDDLETGHRSFSETAKSKTLKPVGSSFVTLLDNQLKKLEDGIVPVSPWVGCLKDELRTSAKVLAKKTRIFEIPSAEMTILVRKEFGHFLSYIKRSFGFQWCHGIGADKEREWQTYYSELTKLGRGKRFLDIDYANYDGSIASEAFEFFREITDEYYRALSDKRMRARHALLHYLEHSYVVLGNTTIRTRGGNKSGNPMTDVLNTITNIFILHCVMMAMRKAQGVTTDPSFFHKQLRMLTYGDDVIIGLSDEALPWFKPDMLIDALGCLGYTATDAQKTKDAQLKVIEDCTFLKSKFVPGYGVVYAPIPKSSIYKALQWEKKKDRGDARIFWQKVEQAQQFMAHWGEVEYNLFQRQLRERGVPPQYVSVPWKARVEALAQNQRGSVAQRSKYS
jgi:hypothetical protein